MKRIEQEDGNLLDKDIRKNGRRPGRSMRSVFTYSVDPEICNILSCKHCGPNVHV